MSTTTTFLSFVEPHLEGIDKLNHNKTEWLQGKYNLVIEKSIKKSLVLLFPNIEDEGSLVRKFLVSFSSQPIPPFCEEII